MQLPSEEDKKGFTLVELLVVIAIISLLASIILVAVSQARIKARDAQRKDNLRQVQKALELYYNDNGHYPTTTISPFFLDETSGGPPSNDVYIPGLVPTYMPHLPHDPLAYSGLCYGWSAGYQYGSNGQDYKLLDLCTAEETVTPSDPFYDPRWDGVGYNSNSYSVFTSGGANW